MRTKHVAFLALILLLPWLSACTESGAMPVTMLGGGVPAAGEGACTSGTAFVTQSASDDLRNLGQYDIGNSFTPATTLYLYSIKVYLNNGSGLTANITIRVDDDTDMTADTLGDATVEIPVAFMGLAEVVIDEHPQLTGSTTYYFGTYSDTGSVDIYFDGTSPSYAGGVYIYESGSGGWVLDSTVAERDVRMEILSCDD